MEVHRYRILFVEGIHSWWDWNHSDAEPRRNVQGEIKTEFPTCIVWEFRRGLCLVIVDPIIAVWPERHTRSDSLQWGSFGKTMIAKFEFQVSNLDIRSTVMTAAWIRDNFALKCFRQLHCCYVLIFWLVRIHHGLLLPILKIEALRNASWWDQEQNHKVTDSRKQGRHDRQTADWTKANWEKFEKLPNTALTSKFHNFASKLLWGSPTSIWLYSDTQAQKQLSCCLVHLFSHGEYAK